MFNLIYWFPLIGACIGIGSVLMTCYFLWRRLKKSKALIIKAFGEKLLGFEQKEEWQEILDHHLEELMMDLRNQIPMGAMLLTPALSGKIRAIARSGILKMLPKLQKRLIEQLAQEMRVEAILLDFMRPEVYWIMAYTGILGFAVGWIVILFT